MRELQLLTTVLRVLYACCCPFLSFTSTLSVLQVSDCSLTAGVDSLLSTVAIDPATFPPLECDFDDRKDFRLSKPQQKAWFAPPE